MHSKIALLVEETAPDEYAGTVMRRMDQYMKSGIEMVWIIDPDAENITVYRRGQPFLLVGKSKRYRHSDDAFDFGCDVEDLIKPRLD